MTSVKQSIESGSAPGPANLDLEPTLRPDVDILSFVVDPPPGKVRSSKDDSILSDPVFANGPSTYWV